MRQPRSIRFQLSSVFVLFFLLVIVLGLFSISWLREFNRVSTRIVEVSLPSTRILGDLNNFTSDFRVAEGRDVLSSSGSGSGVSEDTLAQLDHSIAQAQYSYELVRHDPAETALYTQFNDKWRAYRDIAGEVLSLSRNGHNA